MNLAQYTPEVGQTWCLKSDPRRRLTITRFSSNGVYVYVRRNTSNRKQALLVRTLIRSYRPAEAAR